MALSHSPSIATSNLVLHLDAANRRSYPGTGNTWYDLSGFGNTCFLTNGPALVGTGGTTAMSFDGSNDYGLVYDRASINFFGFALIAWIKFPAIPFSGIAINKEGCYRLYVGESNVNNISARISQSWGALTGPGSTQLVSNKWYQSVVTADGVNQKLYLNGELDFSNNSNLVSTSGSSNLFIATFLGGSYFMNCQMSQIQIYNQSLSAAQIKQNFNATRDRYGV
jgi:hypothetical protein